MKQKLKKRPQKKKAQPVSSPKLSSLLAKGGSRLKGLLLALGLIAVVPTAIYEWVTGEISLAYDKADGRAYAFTLTNTSPVDQDITSFRISLPKQNLAYITTEPVLATTHPDGTTTMPGGNSIWVPAAEFTQLDHQTIPAKSTRSFDIPPLSSRAYAEPDAMMVYVHYAWTPTNKTLALLARWSMALHLIVQEKTIRYVVLRNVWNISPTDDPTEALREMCRDDDQADKGPACASLHKKAPAAL
ncbi:hypothetical protein [Dyella caseinilytica]|uniref:Uncharacterized protein n=1 Tax=Dyella caseinilytica TaxID=1849581 RepID=A0ABX7GSC9_9GAMM|nr:hypothetical protein [Dyella caseinilytica]QRN52707.1 hypothetical protein ISN74_14760 [Dyella caseinilytica]GGA08060.1 hypothetical protein GCM10011408_31750 [Dyella caseinilytica]